jgi:tetratricopeptide (TPR) repeat protein
MGYEEMDYNELTIFRSRELADHLSSRSQRALMCCQEARQLERAGEYENGCEALREFWPNPKGSPLVDGLNPPAQAEVLLRAGMLTGWAGSAHQVHDAQERAKDLISRSIEIFEQLDDSLRAAGARSDLALCYWRQGSFDEARLILRDSIERLGNTDPTARVVAIIRLGMLEKAAGRYDDSLKAYAEAAPLIELNEDHALKGTFHNELASLFARIGATENSEERNDRALLEYAAAGYHFEQAGHLRFRASVENNVAYLLIRLKRFADAHGHLDCARKLWLELKDVKSVAQSDDTRARALLEEGRLAEAESFARKSVAALEGGGEHSILAEALTTEGVVLARLGQLALARVALTRAIDLARESGDPAGAGRAALSYIEELSERTDSTELLSIYEAAAELLNLSQDPQTAKRLIACANRVISCLRPREVQSQPEKRNWEGFSLRHEMLKSEKRFIKEALAEARGIVSHAALLLGFKHHQSLITLINSRHRDLMSSRSQVKARRRSVMRKP